MSIDVPLIYIKELITQNDCSRWVAHEDQDKPFMN